MAIMMHLLYYFLSFGIEWERKQQLLVLQGQARKYIIVEAAHGKAVTECMSSTSSLLWTRPSAVRLELVSPSDWAARFTMTSCSFCSAHALLRFRRRNLPYRLFEVLDGEESKAKSVLEIPACVWDGLANEILSCYDPQPT